MRKQTLVHLHKVHLSLILCLVISFLLPSFAVAQTEEIDAGLAWLLAGQNADGSFGDPAGTGFRDTAATADVLEKLRERGTAYEAALAYLEPISPPSNDHLARKALALIPAGLAAAEISALLDARNEVLGDASRPNYPEGGWGAAPGFATNCLDTALALTALQRAGLAGGLAASDETIALDEVHSYQFELPEGAESLSVLITALSGEIKFQLTAGAPPQPWDPAYTINFAPVNLSGLPLVPGPNYIKITGLAANSTYSFELSYVADGFDSRTLLTPVNYLQAARNGDGGWGLARGADSEVFMTSRVLISLGAFENYYDLSEAVTDGFDWLTANQNLDGGFGATGSTVHETALAYVALAGHDLASLSARNALVFLLGSQLTNGSFNDDPYATAMALWALWASRSDIDTDGDGIPDNRDNCPEAANPGQDNTDDDWWGDACDEDDDNDGLSDNFETNEAGSDPLLIDSDYDGIGDEVEDFDFDGITNLEEEDSGSHPLRPDILLAPGLNLFGYPVGVSEGYSSYDLLYDLGDESEVIAIGRYNRTSGEMEYTTYADELAAGVDFALSNTEGYFVFMNAEKTITFNGEMDCPPVPLEPGLNIAAIPCVTPGYSSFDLLQSLGAPGEVASIQTFNRLNGQFETMAYFEGQPAGTDFDIAHGTALLIHMGTATEIAPFLSGPVVAITSPADGTLLTESPITVSGTVSDSQATVTVNEVIASVTGNTFTAGPVPLSEGANTVAAVARDSNNLTGSHSITVTLEAADYAINTGASVSDSRSFQGESTLLDQAAYYTEEQIGVPSYITYTTTGLSRVSATEIVVNFSIDISPEAGAGIADFQVEYGLLDINAYQLGPLTDNVFDFRVMVLP